MKRFLFIIAILLAMVPTFGQSNIVAGEYFIDTDPGTGHGTFVTVPSPATKDSLIIGLSVASLSLQPGYHVLNYRFRDATGHWGLSSSRNFYILPPAPPISNIVSGEYFIDADPGFGAGTPVSIVSPSTDVTLNLQLSASLFSVGQHNLNYRFLDASGHWSETSSQLFYIQAPVASISTITYGEYFFDTDPGYGSGTSIALTPGTNVTSSFSIPSVSIPNGFHTLQIRFMDQSGKWSQSDSRMFIKVQPDSIAPIVRAEYFFDNDPGTGKGIPLNIGGSLTDLTLNPTASTGGLTVNNFHTVNYRFETSDGKWGLTNSQPFYITDGGKEKYFTPVNKLEIYADNNSDSARTRIDSVGIVMNGYKAKGKFTTTDQDSLTKIGRHFLWARAIDYFGNYGPKYSPGEFVVTTDTTSGMLLGLSLNPDSSIMTSGTVEIYKDSSGVISLFNTVTTDVTGNFLIGNIPQGTYLFLLKPNTFISPTAINTYYDQQPQWEMANFQNVNSDTMFADATIKALKTKTLNGLTGLSGTITSSTKKSIGISITGDRAIEGRPMKGASVVLVGKSNKGGPSVPSNVLASTTSDDSGYYAFANVPKGDYNIIIDILGVPLQSYYTIAVDSTQAIKGNLNYLVGMAGIHILSVGLHKTNDILLYPNPSNGEVNLMFGNTVGKTSLEIVDITGRVVYVQSLEVQSNSVYTFDLHSLGKGMFNMILRNGNSQEVKKLLIQ